jgi:8-oxo-dGTP pyrophosphatase MutT (NUDIX family)
MNKNRETRYSAGIACLRPRTLVNRRQQCAVGQTWDILLVQKRYTYAFNQFAFGDWPGGKAAIIGPAIKRLLNEMTIEEKIDILSMSFDRIWYRIWLRDYRPKNYLVAKHKFETYLMADGGAHLRQWLAESTHAERVWEIPKGRQLRNEARINAAVREFHEETQVPKLFYRLVMGRTWRESTTDEGITYVSSYYVALATKDFEPKVVICNNQVNEISDIKWFSLAQVRALGRPRLTRAATCLVAMVRRPRQHHGLESGRAPPPGLSLAQNNKGEDERACL